MSSGACCQMGSGGLLFCGGVATHLCAPCQRVPAGLRSHPTGRWWLLMSAMSVGNDNALAVRMCDPVSHPVRTVTSW